ncbi:hypothetical protein KJ940_16585 [Myxococcota bacterium]|nr:hypothetical protein [Myxococcota bacterium]
MKGLTTRSRCHLTATLLLSLLGCEGWPPSTSSPDLGPPPPDAAAPPQGTPLLAAGAPAPEARLQPPLTPELFLDAPPATFGVLAALPRGEVAGFVRPTIVFERPVQRRDDPADTVALIRPPLKGRWRWLSSTTAEFISAAPLPWSSRFIVHVPSGRRALDGGVMETDYLFSFSTPRLKPLDGAPMGPGRVAEGLPLWPTLDVLLNQPPDPELFEQRVYLWDGQRRVPLDTRAMTPRRADADDRAVWLKLAPREALAPNTRYELVFDAGLGGLEGPLLTEAATRWALTTYAPLKVSWAGCQKPPCDPSEMAIQLSTPVTSEALARALSLSPPAQLEWPPLSPGAQPSATRWALRGHFTGETRYTLRLTGLVDVFGQKLPAYTNLFNTGPHPPKLRLIPRAPLFLPDEALSWPVEHSGLGALEVSLTRLEPRQLSRVGPNPRGKPLPVKWRKVDLQRATRAPALDALDLRPALSNPHSGLALIQARWREGEARGEIAEVVQISDLGLRLSRGPGEATAWVWDLMTGAPLPGVKVDLFADEGAPISASTDDEGLALLEGLPAQPLLAVAQVGERVAVVSTPAPPAPPLTRGALWLAQALYHPGERVHIRGLVWGEGEQKAASIVALGPSGATVGAWALTPSAAGGLQATLQLNEDAAEGPYRVELRYGEGAPLIAQARFDCARPRPQLMRLELGWAAGELKINARLKSLGRLLGWPVRWRLFARPLALEPRDGFRFGQPSDAAPQIVEGVLHLDAAGAAALKLSDVYQPPTDQPMALRFEVEAYDAERQLEQAHLNHRVYPASVYVGLRPPEGISAAGAPFEVALLPRAVQGVAAPLPEAKVTLRDETGAEIDACVAPAPGRCALTATHSGPHWLEATALDAAGHEGRTRSAIDLRPAPEGEAGAPLRVHLDQPSYRAGEEALVLVDAPEEGAELWLTVEGGRVIHQVRACLAARGGDDEAAEGEAPEGAAAETPEAPAEAPAEAPEGDAAADEAEPRGCADPQAPIAIPITEEMIPNARLKARLIPLSGAAPRGEIVLERALQVRPRDHQLLVKMARAPSPPVEDHADTLNVEITVMNPEGDGISSELSLWGVLAEREDEALMSARRAAFEAALYPANAGGGVEVSDLEIAPVAAPASPVGSPEQGAARAEIPAPRRVAIFKPLVRTDASGRATVEISPPPSLDGAPTTLLLFAVAHGAGRRLGEGTLSLPIDGLRGARPLAPVLARARDRFGAGIALRAPTADLITLSTEISGPARALADRSQQITLEPGVEQRALFPFHATGVGRAQLLFRRDEAVLAEIVLAIEPPGPLRQKILYGATTGRAETALRAEEGFHAGIGDLSLTLAASPLAVLSEEGVDLLEAPALYLEGLISRLVPLIVFPKIMEERARAGQLSRPLREIEEETLARLAALQRPDGGFAYWPGARQSHPWGTAYALWVLHQLDQGGALMPNIALDEAQAYLRAQLNAPDVNEAVKAFCVFVLSELGEGVNEPLNALRPRAEELPLFARAALALVENKRRARREVKALLDYAHTFAGRVRFTESEADAYADALHSNTRTTALILMALLKAEPEHSHARRMVDALLETRRLAVDLEPQDLAFTLLALRRYVATLPEQREGFTGIAELGERRLRVQLNDPLDALSERLPVGALGEGQLTFLVEGEGTLHYLARRRYSPLGPSEAAVNKGFTLQRWYTPKAERGRIFAARVGGEVAVHLRLTTNRPLRYVELIDPIPGGLRPIEASLQRGGEGAASRWYIPFDHVQLEQGELRLFAAYLPPGVYEYSYLCRAEVEGTFTAPSARGRALYAPEIYARAEGGLFWIHPPSAAAFSSTPAPSNDLPR